MSAYFADIDAVCSSLGWMDGEVYKMDPEAVQGLKHLIWILKQDRPAHECRRYIGGKRIVQTDLIPMVISNFDKPDVVDVLLRLLVNLSFPTLLLYNGNYPKDAAEQRKFIRLMEICEEYKEAFSLKSFWSVLGDRLEKILHTDWALRSEADGLIIERILVLIRNVLQVPANVEREKRFDNDASQHDCLLWALHQAGILDIILYILGSPHENRFLIHTLEILSLAYREQSAVHLADATLQRTNTEKKTDELLLIKARQPTAAAAAATTTAALGKTPAGRHSRFRGTYTFNNVKSISDSDSVCHQSLGKIMRMDFSSEKHRQKVSFRNAKETETFERKSIFSVRLFLREYCMEILRVYNNMVRQARRYLSQHGTSVSEFHDDSYLLWAIRFFLEFNRHSGFKIELVSESLNIDTFHWTVTRMDTYTENITTDKTRKAVWARRLHLTIQTYRELLNNMHALEKVKDTAATELLSVLQNNIFYVVEYRETTLHLLTSFKEALHTKAYLRDVIEVAHLFFSMLQRFCKGTVRVQERVKAKRKKTKKQPRKKTTEEEEENIENRWLQEAPTIASLLENGELKQQELPTPFDSASSVPVEEQKGDCLKCIHSLLRKKNYEQAIKMLYAARSIWTTSSCFGNETATPDEDLITLQDIFVANLSSATDADDNDGEMQDNSEEEDELEEEEIVKHEEKDFKFEEFSKRLVDHRVVYACTTVLTDWEKIKTTCLKAAVTLLYRICVEHKMPSMLFQVSLLRIFQAVLNAIEDEHSRELRRLAIYTVRQLQQKVLTGAEDDGGLLFAELLFAKTSRIACALEIGYDEVFNDNGRKSTASQKAWTEEQEQELHRLFMENQENPQTDQDVIDWLLENLIDQTRTRRGVMKKLKEMGLTFKAPTKKSNANRQQKANAWTADEDGKLGVLYEELRLDKNPLKSIAEAFDKKFTRPAIARRMVYLGLIADVAEIMPSKRRANKERRTSGSNGSSQDDERISNSSDEEEEVEKEEEFNQSINKQLNEPLVKKNLKALRGDDMKQAVRWIVECFEEVRSLYEDSDPSEDTEGGVPMIPIAPYQTAALKKPEFKRLLRSLGVMDTGRQFVYHRIPFQLTPEELKKRMEILTAFCEAPTAADEDEEAGDRNVVSPSAASEDEMDKNNHYEEERRSMSPLIVSEDDLAAEDRPANPIAATSKRNRSDSSDATSEVSLVQRPKKNKRVKSQSTAKSSKQRTSATQLAESDDEVKIISPKQTRLVISDDESDMETTSKQATGGLSSQGDDVAETIVPKQSRLVISDDDSETEASLKQQTTGEGSSASELPAEGQSPENPSKSQKARRRAAVISSDEE
uniref:Timeless N-terminal domain-containing protein n=1 Tax=Anopheles melas TaxID=34690 RepID=A0A182TFK2_9DIPT